MSMEEQANKQAVSISQKILKALFNKVWNIIKPEIDKSVEKHNLSSTEKLMRKNPNAGIHKEEGLSKDEALAISKTLKRYRQDFVVKKNNDGKYSITTTNSNKSLLKELCSQVRSKSDQPEKEKLETGLERAGQKTKEINQSRELQDPIKHKKLDIGAR